MTIKKNKENTEKNSIKSEETFDDRLGEMAKKMKM